MTLGGFVDQAIQTALDMLAHPAEDPRATMLFMLAFVALGLLIAVILLAIASPWRATPDTEVADAPVDPSEYEDE